MPTMSMRSLVSVPALALLAYASPALADIPPPVQAMIDAALATGDEAKVRTVIDLAKLTNPDEATAIDAILAGFESELAATKAQQAAAKEQQIREADVFENWNGKGELGAFRSTGNSSNTGISAGLALTREGIDWRHKLTGRMEYQRSNGTTTREQYRMAYEPNFAISERLYAYALAQYERDRFQGYTGRYAVSGGLGYQILDEEDIKLSAKAGPAFRVTDFVDGRSENRFGGLLGIDFDWAITDRLKLTHDTNAVAETGGTATVIIDSGNTSVDLVTGLNAKVSNSLTARFAYAIEYDSNPPPGAVKTDTQSRVTLIYDF